MWCIVKLVISGVYGTFLALEDRFKLKILDKNALSDIRFFRGLGIKTESKIKYDRL